VLCLENNRIALDFDPETGALTSLHNKLTGETYRMDGDEFAIEAEGFRVGFADAQVVSLRLQRGALKARYEAGPLTIDVAYTLGRDAHFVEKRVSFSSRTKYGLRHVTLSWPQFRASGLQLVEYRYPQFGRAPGAEPLCTFFGRTPKGGFFTGVESPFDTSSLKSRRVTLGYAPSLKVRARAKIACEPMYLGVYRRGPHDDVVSPAPTRFPEGDTSADQAWRDAAEAHRTAEVLPLRSESDAMVVMISAILGPPRHGFVPMACGWHSEMQQGTYPSEADVRADMKSLDVLAECGIDWVSDSHPWGGETEKMNALGPDDHYEPGPLVRQFLEHARQIGVKVVMWSSMNHTHHWGPLGKPFRADKPEWLLAPKTLAGKHALIASAKANCFANRPFCDWLTRINREGLQAGRYMAWAMDGSFFGDGGWYTTIVPVDCASDQHDHLPGDSNYASQLALRRLFADVRRVAPESYIFTCRPAQDLGIWALQNVDACFTLLETGTGASNVAAGDAIRTASRVRVQQHFLPHYIDQPLLFPSRAERGIPPNWPSQKLDYILISALSCSPNILMYIPTKTGLPEADKAVLRHWLDWGRRNVEYLKVRVDLPAWPQAGGVDGSAHIIADRGYVFLFNSGAQSAEGRFALDDTIGLTGGKRLRVRGVYPEGLGEACFDRGASATWQVPAESVAILWVEPK
jgi:hypothetical protein